MAKVLKLNAIAGYEAHQLRYQMAQHTDVIRDAICGLRDQSQRMISVMQNLSLLISSLRTFDQAVAAGEIVGVAPVRLELADVNLSLLAEVERIVLNGLNGATLRADGEIILPPAMGAGSTEGGTKP